MAAFDLADLIARCKRLARRPTLSVDVNETSDWTEYLTEAQPEVFADVFSRFPDLGYTAPIRLTSNDGGATYAFGTDAGGNAIRPFAHTELYASLADIPDEPLVAGVDVVIEATLIRIPHNRTRSFTAGPYARFVLSPAVTISDAQLAWLPAGARMLLVWLALEAWASRPGSGANPDYYRARYTLQRTALFLELATAYNRAALNSAPAWLTLPGGVSSGAPAGTTGSSGSSGGVLGPVVVSVTLTPTTLPLGAPASTPAAPGVDEPVFAGTGLVASDTMNSYTSTAAMDVAGSGYRMLPRPGVQFTGAAPDTARLVVVAGRGGTGNAVQINYPADNATQYPNHWVAQGFAPTSGTATHYFQYYAKLGGTNPNVQAIKWFEAFHIGSDRVQWNTHDHTPDPTSALSPTRTYWQFYDQSRDTTGSNHGTQPVGPYFDALFDGAYHRFTHSYKCNTSGTAGATTSRDGFLRLWIDGVKVMDVCQANVGVTPTGGAKSWCTQQDVDMLAVNDGIQYVQWGGARSANTNTGALSVDVDDFMYWVG